MKQRLSLDEIERSAYAPSAAPFDIPAERAELETGRYSYLQPDVLSLDGDWELTEGGGAERVLSDWDAPIPASVPGSVHADLLRAGVIPDPTVGKNDVYAREQSYKTWWYRKRFRAGEEFQQAELHFGGVCHRCDVFLNGIYLGSHTGMFGGPDFDVSGLLRIREENSLVIRLYPAPNNSEDFRDIRKPNHAWKDTVVFNCNYGWHYANMPALGIWRSVTLRQKPPVRLEKPFVTTRSLENGELGLAISMDGGARYIEGRLEISVSPLNFEGGSYRFSHEVKEQSSKAMRHLTFRIPDPQIWYPLDLGDHPLYLLEAGFYPKTGTPEYQTAAFGIRTVEMLPLPGGEKPDAYNWTFCVNGQPLFIKGANWCTLDSLMRLPREKYDRFLSLAAAQHTNLLRAWGSGMVETDDFYDLCDRYGILVMQEWPTAWDSQQVQPPDALRDTVLRSVIRLRSHPSLALWCGANEAFEPTDAVMNMLGRLTYETDGTRAFHRSDPWGGSTHNYKVYWEDHPLDFNLHYQDPFIGEFGLASAPNQTSVLRYLDPQELAEWPPDGNGEFAHHTPMFNTNHDLEHLTRYAGYFGANGSAEGFIRGSQLAQATGIRHTLELARTRRPEASGICYYKLTDVYPACSWSVIDYYGAAKLAYYAVQDAYEPVCAAILPARFQLDPGAENALPVYWLNDLPSLPKGSYQIKTAVYDAALACCAEQTYSDFDPKNPVQLVGSLRIPQQIAASLPLLLTAETVRDGKPLHRKFYWLNFEQSPGCLFRLPPTQLSWTVGNHEATVVNSGRLPAVGITPVFEDDTRSSISDSLLFLKAGEKAVLTYSGKLIGFQAWNVNCKEDTK